MIDMKFMAVIGMFIEGMHEIAMGFGFANQYIFSEQCVWIWFFTGAVWLFNAFALAVGGKIVPNE